MQILTASVLNCIGALDCWRVRWDTKEARSIWVMDTYSKSHYAQLAVLRDSVKYYNLIPLNESHTDIKSLSFRVSRKTQMKLRGRTRWDVSGIIELVPWMRVAWIQHTSMARSSSARGKHPCRPKGLIGYTLNMASLKEHYVRRSASADGDGFCKRWMLPEKVCDGTGTELIPATPPLAWPNAVLEECNEISGGREGITPISRDINNCNWEKSLKLLCEGQSYSWSRDSGGGWVAALLGICVYGWHKHRTWYSMGKN